MAIDTVETKQHAHELVDQLAPNQLDAVVRLLEVIVQDEDRLDSDDIREVSESREYFRQNPNSGLTINHLAAECGLRMVEVRNFPAKP